MSRTPRNYHPREWSPWKRRWAWLPVLAGTNEEIKAGGGVWVKWEWCETRYRLEGSYDPGWVYETRLPQPPTRCPHGFQDWDDCPACRINKETTNG